MTQSNKITSSIIQQRLEAIVAEMGEAMLRTAYSQILNSSRDFSTAIFDGKARLVAQADHIPLHVGALPFAVKMIVDTFGDTVAPGDLFLLNDPYFGGNHLPDVTAFVPVFAPNATRPSFWTINRSHQSDIGGSTHGSYNPAATEIWQEGIRIPPLRLYERGVLREDVLLMIATNVRHPRDFRGDLDAMIGSVRAGERRLHKLIEEYGPAVVDASIEDILDNINVDLSESSPQVTGIVNSSYANTISAVHMALAFLIDADIPKNEGTFRLLSVATKEGTIVHPRAPAPVTLSTNHPSQEIAEAIIKALAGSCPDRVFGGWGRRFRIAIKGIDPRTRKQFIWHLFHARPGAGASENADGWSGVGELSSAGGLKFGSIEVAESRFPFFFTEHEFLPDSAGLGRRRGGFGSALKFRIDTTDDVVGNTAGDGVVTGGAGILGGEDGRPHAYELHPNAGGAPRVLKTKEVGIVMSKGDWLHIRSAGGGGFGNSAERTDAEVAKDVRDGLISK